MADTNRELADIELNAYIRTLLEQLQESYSPDQDIRYICDLESLRMDIVRAVLGLIWPCRSRNRKSGLASTDRLIRRNWFLTFSITQGTIAETVLRGVVMHGVRILISICVLFGVATIAFGQAFPEMEYLDTVLVADGSTLRGRIVEEVPESHLVIEILGGSTFTVAWRNILAVRQERNPYYGREYPSLDMEDLLASELALREEQLARRRKMEAEGRWPPEWIWPVSLGIDFQEGPYGQVGGARQIGTGPWYTGLTAHVSLNDPLPLPFLMVARGEVPQERLLIGKLLILPPGVVGSSWVGGAQIGYSFRRLIISTYLAFGSGAPSGGIGLGYLF
jgi:hypothetical protein